MGHVHAAGQRAMHPCGTAALIDTCEVVYSRQCICLEARDCPWRSWKVALPERSTFSTLGRISCGCPAEWIGFATSSPIATLATLPALHLVICTADGTAKRTAERAAAPMAARSTSTQTNGAPAARFPT